jgi:hypothetical protein
MKNKYTLLLFFAAFNFLGVQCKEERTELEMLPPVTIYGAGTFGCLINGRAWPVYEKGNQNYFLFYHSGRLDLTYTVDNGPSVMFENIVISTNKVNKPGVYWIKYELPGNFFNITYGDELFISDSKSNENSFLYLNISRLDSVNRIVSGTFSFSLYNYWGTKRISVEEGRFDLPY